MIAALPIALTMGEPAGICGELTLKSWLRARRENLPPFYVIGDPSYYTQQAEILGLDIAIARLDNPNQAQEIFRQALPVLPVNLKLPSHPARLEKANAQSVVRSIEKAVCDVQNGQASALVTNPIHKAILYESGFAHPGHTEFLAKLAGHKHKPVMMLACDSLRVVPVTVHLSLRDALESLKTQEIVEISKITHQSLRQNFGITRPRLGMAALNPHAGENGKMGMEEIEIIQPAIDILRREGIAVSKPLPADTLFHANARKNWDVVICMYHDQALVPLKTIDFSGGVNITLGLPFIRTSPDHGTALDIAGQNKANPDSLINALKQAAKMAGK